MDVIPYGSHVIDEADLQAVMEALQSGWLTQGPRVTEFEELVAQRCGTRHAVACNSGTAALHLAMLAAGLQTGDHFVVPAVTFLATANCGVYVGARPEFCDVDPVTANMTPETLEPHLRDETRAVLPVHFAGAPCDMPSLSRLVRSRSPQAVIIEDACHALGGVHADRTPIGALNWADMSVFSFHPVKHVAAGEGGMVLTNRDDLADRLRLYRSHGMTKDAAQLSRPNEGPWYYEMHNLGFNYRIPEINCALALSQMKKLDEFIDRRRSIAVRYLDELSDMPHVELPLRAQLETSAWHIFCLRIDFAALGTSRTQVMQQLREQGVGTQVHYYPVPLQPFYRNMLGCRPGQFPGAEQHYARTLTIPLFPSMSDGDVGQVISAVRRVVVASTSTARSTAA